MFAADYRERARNSLGNNIFSNQWLMALALLFVYSTVSGLAASVTCGVATLIIVGPLSIGYASALLEGSRKKEAVSIEKLFKDGFTNDIGRAILLGFLKYIFITLWSLLLVIPGIIKTLSYSMAEFIAVDHPEYTWNECITKSRELMDGNKWRFFCLQLSFIGWAILTCFTCGIGNLWLTPYISMANTEFYRDLIKDNTTY